MIETALAELRTGAPASLLAGVLLKAGLADAYARVLAGEVITLVARAGQNRHRASGLQECS